MDAHRLRAVFDLIISEHSRLGIDTKMAELLQAVGACVSKPSSKSDERFRTALTDLITALHRARTNDFVESNRRILVEIEGERIIGNGLAERILHVANERPFLPARARDEFVEIADDLQRRLGACVAARTAFDQLNLGPVQLAEGEFELGLLLPDSLVRGDLERLYKELRDWNHMLHELTRVISSKPVAVGLRTFTTSRFELTAKLGRQCALVIGSMIAGIYELARKVQANREKSAELERNDYPADIVGRIVEYEKTMVQREMKAIRQHVAATYLGEIGRRREVEKVLDRSLRFMSQRMREGVEMEVLCPMIGDALVTSDPAKPNGEAPRRVTHHVRASLHIAAQPKPAAPQKPAPEVSPELAAARQERPVHMPLSKITGESEAA